MELMDYYLIAIIWICLLCDPCCSTLFNSLVFTLYRCLCSLYVFLSVRMRQHRDELLISQRSLPQLVYRRADELYSSRWDDWVTASRIRKDTAEHRELALSLKNLYSGAKATGAAKEDAVNGEKPSKKRQRDNETETVCHTRSIAIRSAQLTSQPKEEEFLRRPEVRIPIPDHLKAILVDDWENVTKNNELVKLPSEHPVNQVLDTYFEQEKQKRRPGSADVDLLEEFIAGTKSYFTRCLGRILLYKFEKLQYAEIRKAWDNAPTGGDMDGKGPGDVYGPEHLARLVVKLPELIAQTNMDRQSVDRLREEMTKLCLWLSRNSGTYFTAAYEKPTPEYLENAKPSK